VAGEKTTKWGLWKRKSENPKERVKKKGDAGEESAWTKVFGNKKETPTPPDENDEGENKKRRPKNTKPKSTIGIKSRKRKKGRRRKARKNYE